MFQKVLQRVNGAISLSLSCWALPFCFTCNDFYITNIIGISHIGQWLVRKNTEKWPWEGNPRSDLVGFELQTHKQTTYNIASISIESVLIWHLLDSGLRELDQTPRHMFKPYQTKQGNRCFFFYCLSYSPPLIKGHSFVQITEQNIGACFCPFTIF